MYMIDYLKQMVLFVPRFEAVSKEHGSRRSHVSRNLLILN